MQPSHFDLATVVKEDDHTSGGRMYRSVIRGGHKCIHGHRLCADQQKFSQLLEERHRHEEGYNLFFIRVNLWPTSPSKSRYLDPALHHRR